MTENPYTRKELMGRHRHAQGHARCLRLFKMTKKEAAFARTAKSNYARSVMALNSVMEVKKVEVPCARSEELHIGGAILIA